MSIVVGGAVTATLTAPSVGTVTEFYRSDFTFWDQPHALEID